MKIEIRTLGWIFLIWIFAFQRALTDVWNGFNYLDELFAIYCIVVILFRIIISKNTILNNKETQVLYSLLAVLILGIISTLCSKLLTSPFWIIVDIISTIKVWLGYFFVVTSNGKVEMCDGVIKGAAKFGRILVWIMLVSFIISQFYDIGMLSEISVRYGIHSFQFIYNVPGNFSKLFYFLIPLLYADLYYKNTFIKRITIYCAFFVWAVSMRSRAWAFILCTIIGYVFCFVIKKYEKMNSQKGHIKIWHIVILGVLLGTITWKQIVFYFTTMTQARNVLLRYGVETMFHYFPFGAGYGTFGSDVASRLYSPLYVRYGFEQYYGMKKGQEYFLNDNYWPMIMGQFGFLGLVLIIFSLVILSKYALKIVRSNFYYYYALLLALGYLLASSVASKSYSEYSSICIFLLIGMLVKRQKLFDLAEK